VGYISWLWVTSVGCGISSKLWFETRFGYFFAVVIRLASMMPTPGKYDDKLLQVHLVYGVCSRDAVQQGCPMEDLAPSAVIAKSRYPWHRSIGNAKSSCATDLNWIFHCSAITKALSYVVKLVNAITVSCGT
jgi:hypothetical protein